MASLPHTPPSSTPVTPYTHLGPASAGSSREGARFTSRSTTPIPSAVQHSRRPVRDIVSGSGLHDQSQRDSASSSGRNMEEVEYSPPGAFPGAEEAREPDAGEEMKHAVAAIRGYAKPYLQAALGGYAGDKQDENRSHNNHGTSGEPSALSPKAQEPSPELQSSSTSDTSSSHDSFRDPECAQASQPDIDQGNVESAESGTRTSLSESFPTTTRPSGYTDEPSAWTSPYADTFVPPLRTYDVVREHSADQSQDISSGFGGRIDTVSPLEPITTARAVPFIAEPPLVVYSKTSASTYVPTGDETRQSEARSSEASVQDASSRGTPTISDDEQSANQGADAEGRDVDEKPRDSSTEAKEKPKGIFSRLGNFVHGIYAGKQSKEESSTTQPDSSQPTADESAGIQSNPGDAPSAEPPVKKSWFGRATSLVGGAHSESTGFRHHIRSDNIPKNVPAHFDETIGPLPRHVQLRGKGEFPTKEKPSGSRVGVGSLPGRRDEAGVARLPDERSGVVAAPQSRAYDEQDSQSMDREDERGAEGPSTSQARQQRSSFTHSSSSSASSEGAEQVSEPRSGLLSGLICDVEEILQDLGGVALYYVPGFDYLSKSDPKVDLPAESQPADTTEESKAQSSPSPSPVAAASPTRAPPSSPLVGMQTDPRQASVKGTNSGCESSRSAATTPPLVPDSRPFSTQFSASLQSDRLATPMDPSAHPSRSSSAEEVNHEVFIVGPPSTRERISGKQERVASALQREYEKSPTFEEHAAAGAAGSLPWYPTETGLRALIGERMHDDQMRAAGAAEPEEVAGSALTNTREVPKEEPPKEEPKEVSKEEYKEEAKEEAKEEYKEEPTTNEVPIENKLPARSQTLPAYPVLAPPPIRVTTHDGVETTAKGFDIKSLGPPVAEGHQGVKKPAGIFAEQRRKSHN